MYVCVVLFLKTFLEFELLICIPSSSVVCFNTQYILLLSIAFMQDSSSSRAGNKPITKPRPKNIEPPPKPEKIDPLFGAGLSTESPVAATVPRNHLIPSMVRVVPPKDTVATVDDDDEDDEDLFTSSDDESDANTKVRDFRAMRPEMSLFEGGGHPLLQRKGVQI